jgi:DNA-binding winged helix-turn-helix (wHTH) protein
VSVRYRWDDFVLDLDAYRLERGGRPVALEPKALNLLAFMIRRPGQLCTKPEIFDAVWPNTAVTDHALTRVVAQLRRALGEDVKDAKYLETVPTRGYRWIRPVEAETGPRTKVPPPIVSADPPARAVSRRRPILLTIAAAVGVIVAAAVMWARFESSDGSAKPSTGVPNLPSQITTHTGLDLNPALSARGDALAFASDRSGAFEIYIRSNVSGSHEVALTSDGGQNVQPAWSPDGRQLAYHSASRGGIWVVPASGGTPRQVALQGSNPEWSPDGRQIAYQSDEHSDIAPTGFAAHVGSTLWAVDAGGGTPRPLTERGKPQGGHATPAWSRSGDYIAFSVFDGGPDDGLWVLQTQTGRVTAISRGLSVRWRDGPVLGAPRASRIARRSGCPRALHVGRRP